MPRVTELVRVEPGIRCEPPCTSTHTLSTAPRGVEVFFPAYPPGFANQDLSSSLYMCTCVSSLASSSVCVCVFSGPSTSPCYNHLSSQTEISVACKQPCSQTYVSPISSLSSVNRVRAKTVSSN